VKILSLFMVSPHFIENQVMDLPVIP
jgi:hypothetical protein